MYLRAKYSRPELLLIAAVFLLPALLTKESIAAESCSGAIVEINNRIFEVGETATCVATESLDIGPTVTLREKANVCLRSPVITFNPPLQVAHGATLNAGRYVVGFPNQAQLGPLAGATINAYRLTDLNTPVEGPITADSTPDNLDLAGQFSIDLLCIPDNEWILVTATGGEDIDFDDDGVIDATSTPNAGTISALATAGVWRAGNNNISVVTDILWRYTRNLVGVVDPHELSIRINDLARQFIAQDIDEDGAIDWQDALTFTPRDAAHQGKLNFDFQRLFTLDDAGDSLILALHGSDEKLVANQLDAQFGHTLTRSPVPDSRYTSIKIHLALFGEGRVTSDYVHGLVVDASNPLANNQVIYTPQQPAKSITFTAIPAAETLILGWQGCDTLSADLSQCSVALNRSHDVLASFGVKTTLLAGTVHDLSRSINTLSPDAVDVVIQDGLDDMVAQLATLQVDDFIVGATLDGFLRKVASINKLDDNHYILGTVEASLDEVIQQGTGTLVKAMTNSDLPGYTPSTSTSGATLSAEAFTGLGGIELIPSNNPDDTLFTLAFGHRLADAAQEMAPLTLTEEVVLYDDGAGGTVTASGTVSLEIMFDTGFDYRLLTGLESFRFITNVTSTQGLTLSVTGDIDHLGGDDDPLEKKIGSISFSKIVFFIGPVPVWITPKLDVYVGVEGKLEVELTTGVELQQVTRAGITYNRISGFDAIGSLVPGWKWEGVEVTGRVTLTGYLKTKPIVLLYDATGPALPLKGYIEYVTSLGDTWFTDRCIDGYKVGISLGIQSEFKWDLSGGAKIGEFLHLDQLEEQSQFTLMSMNWPWKEWTILSTCTAKPPFLDVAGDPILAELEAGTPAGSATATTVTLANEGDAELSWRAGFRSGSEIIVDPTSGALSPAAMATVQIAVDSSLLPVGEYSNPVSFINTYDEELPDSETGTRAVAVDIQVMPNTPAVTPVITNLTSPSPGVVSINWSFDPVSTDVALTSYHIYSSITPSDPDSWVLRSVTDIDASSLLLSGAYDGGSTVTFIVEAHGDGVSTLPSTQLSVVITGDVIPPPSGSMRLNDTGITWGGNYPSGNNTTCTSNVSSPQDCRQGRDFTHNDDSDGHAGFSYTKISSTGAPLPASATSWSCVKDNVTGLMWEVKTGDGEIHDKENTYRWGGKTHLGSDFGTYYPDWDRLVDASNDETLCGFNEWRVPNIKELENLASRDRINPVIDTDYFPYTISSNYWSASPRAALSERAWFVSFGHGYPSVYPRDIYSHVRLVRGGE